MGAKPGFSFTRFGLAALFVALALFGAACAKERPISPPGISLDGPALFLFYTDN